MGWEIRYIYIISCARWCLFLYFYNSICECLFRALLQKGELNEVCAVFIEDVEMCTEMSSPGDQKRAHLKIKCQYRV